MLKRTPQLRKHLYILFYPQADHKKIGHELIYLFFFSCSYIKITLFKFALFSVSINY
jgi:hypothetical protein